MEGSVKVGTNKLFFKLNPFSASFIRPILEIVTFLSSEDLLPRDPSKDISSPSILRPVIDSSRSSAVESIDRIVAEVHPNEQERIRNRLADVLVAIISQKLVPSLDGKRVLAKEVLLVTPSVKAAIKNNNTSEIYMMINQGASSGMITMEQDLKRLYLSKKISMENAIAYANNKTVIQQILSAF